MTYSTYIFDKRQFGKFEGMEINFHSPISKSLFRISNRRRRDYSTVSARLVGLHLFQNITYLHPGASFPLPLSFSEGTKRESSAEKIPRHAVCSPYRISTSDRLVALLHTLGQFDLILESQAQRLQVRTVQQHGDECSAERASRHFSSIPSCFEVFFSSN